jgi:hypothetical protein
MAGVAVTAALLVPLSIFGGSALAGGSSAASSQYQYRVTICHLTGSKKHPAHTITVSSASVAKHLARGDHLGPCTAADTKPKPKKHTTTTASVTPAAPTTSSSDHGKSEGHKKK